MDAQTLRDVVEVQAELLEAVAELTDRVSKLEAAIRAQQPDAFDLEPEG